MHYIDLIWRSFQCAKSRPSRTESCSGEIARLFDFSAKRRLLDACINKLDSVPRAKKLKDVCRTRWVERIEAYATLLQLLPAVNTCLKAMAHPRLHTESELGWGNSNEGKWLSLSVAVLFFSSFFLHSSSTPSAEGADT